MIIKLNITDDLIKLLPTLYIQEEGDNKIVIDREWLFGGTHILEDISLALGIHDHAIKGTEDDPEGRAFNEEDTKRMLDLYNYVKGNLYYIETLIHQYAFKGGISVGEYKTKDSSLIWEKCNV